MTGINLDADYADRSCSSRRGLRGSQKLFLLIRAIPALIRFDATGVSNRGPSQLGHRSDQWSGSVVDPYAGFVPFYPLPSIPLRMTSADACRGVERAAASPPNAVN